MPRRNAISHDHLGAALLIVMGVGVLGLGATYRIGTLSRMGAGFIPVVLGVLMILIGLAIAITASPADRAKPSTNAHGAIAAGPQWRGWLCILGGVAAFVVFGRFGGLVPATFAAVFISALGDRQSTVKTSAALAAIIDVFGVIVFHYGLHLQLPLFQWN
jgi:hypothetical protein